jgi:hypothetical protein
MMMTTTTSKTVTGYTSYGNVRGQSQVYATLAEAEADLARDQKGCRKQGGYSDRHIAYVGSDGYLYADDACEQVIWPSHGRSNGAVRADLGDDGRASYEAGAAGIPTAKGMTMTTNEYPTETDYVAGMPIEHDNSGVGHNWRRISRDDIPADVAEEIEGEIIDGKRETCDDFLASNGLHYRW